MVDEKLTFDLLNRHVHIEKAFLSEMMDENILHLNSTIKLAKLLLLILQLAIMLIHY